MVFLAQENVVGTILLQCREFFSVGQPPSVQVALCVPFYVEMGFIPPCKMTYFPLDVLYVSSLLHY